jgi:hypothetical protein
MTGSYQLRMWDKNSGDEGACQNTAVANYNVRTEDDKVNNDKPREDAVIFSI